MEVFNRTIWIVIFFLGAAVVVWLEWQSDDGSSMVGFMLTSLWSAVCGICYTVIHWFIVEREHGNSGQG